MIRAKGLKPNVVRQPSADRRRDLRLLRRPRSPETTFRKNNFVTIYVSTGPPKTEVPDVVGEQQDRALSDLQDAKLKGKTVQVESDKPEGAGDLAVADRGRVGEAGRDGEAQCLEGAETGGGPERDRLDLRVGELDPARTGIRGQARGRDVGRSRRTPSSTRARASERSSRRTRRSPSWCRRARRPPPCPT